MNSCEDLLFSTSLEITAENIDAPETEGQNRWRWALGQEPRIFFRPSLNSRYLNYHLTLPIFGAQLKISVNGREKIRLYAFKKNQPCSGSIELNLLDHELNEEVEIGFSITRWNKAPDNFSPKDTRPLAFALSNLEISATAKKQDNTHELMQTVCAAAFSQAYISEQQQVGVCCTEKTTGAPDFSELQDFNNEKSLIAAWNTPHFLTVRKTMLAGVRPASCRKCFSVEDGGGSSVRNLVNQRHMKDALAMIELMDSDGRIFASPRMLDIKMGNRCNLSCRMCWPSASANLIREFEKIYPVDFSQYKNSRWFNSDDRVRALAKACKDVQTVHIAGGEPFLTPQFRIFLHELVEHGLSHEINLIFSTNCTTLNQEVLKLFPSFKNVTMVVSLDGPAEVNNFIRYPSRFSEIDENLHHLQENMEALKISQVRFNTTVQAQNVFHIPELFLYLRNGFPKFHWCPKLSILTEPEYFSLGILPKEIRKLAADHLENFINEEAKRWQQEKQEDGLVSFQNIRDEVTGLIHFLQNGADKTHLLPEFHRVSAILNAGRPRAKIVDIPGLEQGKTNANLENRP